MRNANRVLLVILMTAPLCAVAQGDGSDLSYVSWVWIPGTAFGVIAGLWGSLAGTLASLGRGRMLVMASGWFLDAVAIVMLAVGIVLFLMGKPWGMWYAFLLPGIIGAVLFSIFPWVMKRRYAEVEAQRMKQQEAAGSLD